MRAMRVTRAMRATRATRATKVMREQGAMAALNRCRLGDAKYDSGFQIASCVHRMATVTGSCPCTCASTEDDSDPPKLIQKAWYCLLPHVAFC